MWTTSSPQVVHREFPDPNRIIDARRGCSRGRHFLPTESISEAELHELHLMWAEEQSDMGPMSLLLAPRPLGLHVQDYARFPVCV
jgi:hypothetical protein